MAPHDILGTIGVGFIQDPPAQIPIHLTFTEETGKDKAVGETKGNKPETGTDLGGQQQQQQPTFRTALQIKEV